MDYRRRCCFHYFTSGVFCSMVFKTNEYNGRIDRNVVGFCILCYIACNRKYHICIFLILGILMNFFISMAVSSLRQDLILLLFVELGIGMNMNLIT